MRLLDTFSFKSKSRLGQRRRRVKSMWRRPSLVYFTMILVTIVAGWRCWQLWENESIHRFAAMAKQDFIDRSSRGGFSVSEVFVEGRVETDKKALLDALRLRRGTPILDFDAEAALARVTTLPWVRTAIIERQLPDAIYMSLVERRPLVLWQNERRFELVDTHGELIPIRDVGRFSNLIIVIGNDAPRFASQLLNLLALAPSLARRVKAAVRIGERRWDIKLNNEIEVLLPEMEAVVAWVRLAELQERYGLLEKEVVTIDLRLPDRIVVRQKLGKEDNINPTNNTKYGKSIYGSRREI